MTLAHAMRLGVSIRRASNVWWVVLYRGVPQGGGRNMVEAVEGAWMVAKEAALIAETEPQLVM